MGSNMQQMEIGDLGSVVTGKTPSTKNQAFWDGNVPFVTPADLQKTKHIMNTARYVTKEGVNAVKGAALPPGSICVSCIGNLGYVAMTNNLSIANQQINSIIPSKHFDSDYVYYLLYVIL